MRTVFFLILLPLLWGACGCCYEQQQRRINDRLRTGLLQELPEAVGESWRRELQRTPEAIATIARVGDYAAKIYPVLVVSRRDGNTFDASLYLLSAIACRGDDDVFFDLGMPVRFTIRLDDDEEMRFSDFHVLPHAGFRPQLFPRSWRYSLQLLPYPWFSSQLQPYAGEYFILTDLDAIRFHRYGGHVNLDMDASFRICRNQGELTWLDRESVLVATSGDMPEQVTLVTKNHFSGTLAIEQQSVNSFPCFLQVEMLKNLPLPSVVPAGEEGR